MKIFPNDNFKIRTQTKEVEVIKILSNCVEPIKNFRGSILSSVSENKFEGEIFGNEFIIQKIIYGRNIFNPKIIGNIESYENGTEIDIDFEIEYSERIVFTIIFSILLVVQFFSIITNLENRTISSSSFAPTFFIILIFIMMKLTYNYEINSTKVELKEIFKDTTK